MFQTSESTKAITTALLQFQGHVSGVKRDAKNPHFRSNYATLENVIDTARPVLQECGVAFVQAPGAIVDGALEVTTRLSHAESGEWIQSTMHMPLGKRDPQGAGSATTYALRYSLMAMLGLPPTDDDGEAAMNRDEPPTPAKRQVGWNKEGTERTAHSLKKEGSWETLKAELDNDLVDCHTTKQLDELKEIYRGKAKELHWPTKWLFALSDVFETHGQMLERMADSDTFPGDTPANSNFSHPIMAGE